MKCDRLLNALTQQELAQLIEVLFTVLPPDLQQAAIAQLPENAQQIVKQILLPSSIAESTEASATQTVSLAKQAQIWSELWQEWDDIVSEASEEGGKYILQEAHWEPPYFDATTFSEDLERVAAQMRSLIQTAFVQQFTPDHGFVTALLEAESAISEGLEDWMEVTDGLYLENHSTHCLLQWERLVAQQQEQNAFQLAHHVRACELQFQEKQYAPADLLEQVMNYWKTHLQNFVPKPESAAKSDYTHHAKWMVALKELSPQNYETLLAQWRNDHQRRSNLWKAMKQMGLG
ncbi:MAG TPA: hypothetical protein V6C84_01750 [Coleofasciculaceae cyanobacterium]|jgi:hypothetical protein